MNLRKATALLLAAAMIAMMCTACSTTTTPTSTGTSATTTAPSDSTSATTTLQPTATPIQPVTLSVYAFVPTGAVDGIQTDPTSEYIRQKTGFTIDLIVGGNSDDTKYTAMVASGDLPDVMEVIPTTSETAPALVKDLISANMLMPLDDLLNQYGADILANAKSMVDFCRANYAVDGKLYDLQAVIDPGSHTNANKAMTLRFDYYAELGYPTINSADDWLNVVSAMLKAHPKTDTGETRYGFSPFFSWGLAEILSYGQEILEMSNNIQVGDYGFYTSYNCTSDDRITSTILDEKSSLWTGAEFIYKANKMGLVDSDMFTNTWDTVNTKATADRVLSCSWNWEYYTVNAKLNKDGMGYAVIKPDNQKGYFWGSNSDTGGSTRLWTIPAKSRNPEAAMRFINYLYTYDGCLTVHSGVLGTDYVVNADGKLMIPASVITARKTDSNYALARGVNKYDGLAGLGVNVVDPQYNQTLGLTEDRDLEVLDELSSFEKLYCQHYGIERPKNIYDSLKNYYVNGVVISLLETPPDNIAEMDTDINTYITTAIENLIVAKDDAAFAAGKAEIIQTCKDKGIDQSFAWWKENWENAMAKANVS